MMSEPRNGPDPTDRIAPVPPQRAGRRRDAGAVVEVCPLLVSEDGAWRSAYASRDHRCWAVRPPAALNLAKQRDLCLTPAHAACSTFLATQAPRRADEVGSAAPDAEDGSLLWPSVRLTPLVLEPSRGRTGALAATSGRTGSQALLVGLMVVAFVVLVIARTTAPSQAPSATPDSSVISVASPVPRVTPSPAASPTGPASASPAPGGSPTPSGSVGVTPAATVSPTPSVGRRYTVQSGDTLSGIAARFGSTVKAIAEANGITDPGLIRVGQVLIIP